MTRISSMELENSSPITGTSGSGSSPALPPSKKKRNLPGTPDPNAEVIALSPTTLLASNRFICEICNKGFQRDQNLQLHRRGHNLPWKLKQRSSTEARKKVYLCPEPLCVHHDPARALGDLTGIKKHYSRKHGEKKWKCDRCSKKYAVPADWKAHMKTCGSREYKCDCGTLFSRRDSFVTHRAFCEGLAEEGSRAHSVATVNAPEKKLTPIPVVSSPPPPPPLTPSAAVISPVGLTHSPELPENSTVVSQQKAVTTCSTTTTTAATATPTATAQSSMAFGNGISSTRVFASIFAPSTSSNISQPCQNTTSYTHQRSTISQPDHHLQTAAESPTLCLLPPPPSLFLSNHDFSLFPTHDQDHHRNFPSQPAMSATALLQKATQMGVTSSNTSFLHGLGLSVSSDEPNGSRMIGSRSTSIYGNKPTTLDLLGLGLSRTNPPNGVLSTLFTSFEDKLQRNSNYPVQSHPWGEPNETLE